MSKTMDRLELLSPEKRALLALKAKQKQMKDQAAALAIPKQPRKEGLNSFPLSFPQQRVMFHEEYMPGTDRYNFGNGYRMKGKLNVPALHQTLNAMVRRHEVMRSYIAVENDEYVQVIRPELHIDLPVIELEDETQLYDRMEQEAKKPYDFLNGPLVKANLFRIGPEEHVLVWMTHHIVYDGWSADVFEEELAAFYRAYTLNIPVKLPELPIQYPDFAVWQRGWMQGKEYDSQLNYWAKKMTPPPATLDLPTDFPRPSILREKNAGLVTLQLDEAFAQRVRETSKQLGCTTFVLLLAAYKLQLAAYNGKQEIVVGTPMANRGKQEIEKLTGFFANSVALRSQLNLYDNFTTFVQELRETVLEANDNQDLPFDRLIEVMNPDRVVGHSLFFDTMFLVERHGQAAIELPDLEISPVAGDLTRGGVLDLTMTVYEKRGRGFEVTLTYHRDLFRESTMNRMTAHYKSILERLVANPARPMVELASVTDADRIAIMETWNAKAAPEPDVMLPYAWAARQAAITPDATAVMSEGSALTYRELNERANRLAHYLRKRQVGPNRTVGLYMERTVDILVGLLGILKAGGAYVPLDPKLPVDRLRTIVQEADVSVVVSELAFAELLPCDELPGLDIVALDLDWHLIEREDAEEPASLSKPSDLMYLLFTSGSTGKPKGVVVEHRSYANYMEGIMERMAVKKGLHYAIVSTLAADLGTPMIWGALATGGTVHIIPYERAADPDAFASYCREHPIDVMKIVPSHFEALMGIPDPATIIPRECLVFAGEASHWRTVAAVRKLRPGCRIQNHYGPTETTVSVLAYEVPELGQEDHQAVLPLGNPLPNAPIYVLNGYMQPVPIGAIGELYIGGKAVTRGYYGRPELTAERYMPDPFSSEPGGRMYKTGDLVRYLPNGTIQFIGRADLQVKIRGYRIETGEVEHALEQIEGVRDAVVIVREDEPGDKRLVAYLVAERQGGNPLDIPALRKQLKLTMPDYMIPSAFVELERLPLNANGKLDRALLPAPDPASRASDSAYAEPTTDTEKEIAAVWRDVLGLEKIGIDDEFFDLGGDSFKAIKVVRRMGNSFSVMDLFQFPTIRELSEQLSAGSSRGDDLLIEFKKAATIGGKARTLVCVPYGGGSAITFQPMAKVLPQNYSLYAVQLPGHDYSRPDQPLASMEETAARCAEEMKSKVADGEVFLYGHCLGGAMVLRIGLLLEEAGFKVSGVFMAGTFPGARLPLKLTEWWYRMFPREKWTSDKFTRDMLRAFGGFDDEVSPEEEKFVLRNLRHDAKEAEDYYTELYAREERPKLKAPVACIVGGADRMTEFFEERYLEWHDFSHDVQLHIVDHAGHYFHKHQSDQVAKIIAQQIRVWEEEKESAKNKAARRSPEASNGWQPQRERPEKRAVQPSVKSFLTVTLCLIIATIGTSLTGFALGIHVYEETGSISDYATISLYAILPTLLLLPVAGAVVDRYDRRKVMLAGQALALCSSLFLAVMLYMDALSLWVVYVAATVGSIAGAFTMPAYQAATAQLVPKRYLGNANGLGQLIMSLNGIVAPAFGGAMVVLIGLKTIIVMDIMLLSLAILILSNMRFPDLMFKKREEPMSKEIVGGWKYIVNRKSLMAMVVFFIVVNFFMSLYNVLTTPFLLQFMTADKVGMMIAFEGAGLLIGSIVMSVWGGFDRRADGMVGFVMLTGLSIAIMGLFPSLVTAAIGLFGFGLALALLNTHWLALIQTKVGLELQGRVLATNQVMAFSMRPLSFLLAGPLVGSIFVPLADRLPAGTAAAGLFETGEGQGIGLLMASIGVILFVWSFLGMRYRPLRHMETILPDAVPDAVIIRDKDKLQQLADRQMGVSM